MLVAAAFVVVGYRAPNGLPLQGHYTLRAELADGANIAPHDTVRLAGRRVGQVLEPRVVGTRALVELQLDQGVAPLRSDTRLIPRGRSVLGQHFIEIVPGTEGRPLAEGELIPASQSASIVDLDEALRTFDPETREQTTELLNGLGTATAGRGAQLNEALEALPPLTGELGDVAAALNRRGAPLGRLISEAERLSAAVDPVRGELAAGLEPERRLFGALAAESDALAAAVEAAPAALRSIRTELPATDAFLGSLDRLARHSQPTLELLPGALRETELLLRRGRPALRSLPPLLERADTALPAAGTLLEELRPSLGPAARSLQGGRHPIDAIGERTCDLTTFLDRLGGDPGAFTFRDGASALLRFELVPQLELAGAPLEVAGNAYPAPCEADRERAR